jgi:hypothetical protein
MNDTEIRLPIILMLDDGLHLYSTLAEAAIDLEVIDVKNNSCWRGYDSSGMGVRLGIGTTMHSFFWVKIARESVVILADNTTIEKDIEFRSAMRDFLTESGVVDSNFLSESSGISLLEKCIELLSENN